MHSGASREILDLGQPELGCWFRTSQVRNILRCISRDFAPPDFEDVRHRTSAGREMTSALDNSRGDRRVTFDSSSIRNRCRGPHLWQPAAARRDVDDSTRRRNLRYRDVARSLTAGFFVSIIIGNTRVLMRALLGFLGLVCVDAGAATSNDGPLARDERVAAVQALLGEISARRPGDNADGLPEELASNICSRCSRGRS